MKTIRNRPGGFAGQRCNIIGAAVVAFGPEVRVGIGADELKVHVDLAVGAGDGAFEDAVDVEGAGDFAAEACGAFVLHDGGARGDAEVGVLGEHGDELIGHAVGEVFLIGIAREVVEGDDGERGDGRVRVSMQKACDLARADGHHDE